MYSPLVFSCPLALSILRYLYSTTFNLSSSFTVKTSKFRTLTKQNIIYYINFFQIYLTPPQKKTFLTSQMLKYSCPCG
jgi:hypothetical protein